jgi:arginyl-tRNA synthetase
MHDTLVKALRGILTDLGAPEAKFAVEHPADLTHGDFATNAALAAAKMLGKNPKELAEDIAARLKGAGIAAIEDVSVAGPGFINITLARTFFAESVAQVRQVGDVWGSNDRHVGKKVVVEYTDPNPFKEFHVGHLFTNTVGESIARLFMASGASVKRVNYQGDVGLHVASALWGMWKLGLTAAGGFTAADLGRAYAKGATAYKEDEQAAKEIRELNKLTYARTDESLNRLYDAGRAVSLEYFEALYAILGTAFDDYFFESEAGPRGKELVLAHPDVFVESDGARVFMGEQYGLHTRVFLNKEGLPTYEAKELALAKLKEERLGVYDLSVISTSNEITEYFKVLKKAMSFVYPELAAKTEHIGHGTVRLATGKMSSRTGDVIPALSFIDEVAARATEKMVESGRTAPSEELARDIAIAAIKYATLRGNVLQNSVFDKEQALSFEGESGPYLQYTAARAHSVLKKAAEEGIAPGIKNAPEAPFALERILYRFPEVVARALEDRSPHHVAQFLTELAGSFNTFYAQERIADASDPASGYKVALTEAVAITLRNGLYLLGIKTPKEM